MPNPLLTRLAAEAEYDVSTDQRNSTPSFSKVLAIKFPGGDPRDILTKGNVRYMAGGKGMETSLQARAPDPLDCRKVAMILMALPVLFFTGV